MEPPAFGFPFGTLTDSEPSEAVWYPGQTAEDDTFSLLPAEVSYFETMGVGENRRFQAQSEEGDPGVQVMTGYMHTNAHLWRTPGSDVAATDTFDAELRQPGDFAPPIHVEITRDLPTDEVR